ncbi:MAG: L,D-transpeptidase [Aliarcobacter sp.]|nr:L,D-transpeptidase [Aliarcobacter sp.]
MNKFLFYVLINILIFNSPAFSLETQSYSISVCTTLSLENANNCKKNIKKNHKLDIFIVKEKEKYKTYLGSFSSYSQAKKVLDNSSIFVKKQEAFIKKLPLNLNSANKKNLSFIDMSNISKNKEKKEEKSFSFNINDEIKILDEFKLLGSSIIDKYTPTLKTPRKVDNLLSDFAYFDSLIIEVDSSNNIMKVSGKSKRGLKNLKTYKVSTAKKDIKKPLGEGKVTSIALNPIWYPTVDTIQSFKKRGIDLPKVVLGGDKLNYMGSAKINLTHKVDGKETFRIHGTLDEKTIGSYESSGCIRMRNSEVIQLVSILNEFIDFKSMSDIKVILK